jgi:deoxyribonuclease-4
LGFSQVKLIHLNDSLKPMGSHVDRHAQIGQGCIGKEGFRSFFSVQKIRTLPCILEVPQLTPKDDILQLQLGDRFREKRRKCQINI